MQAHVCLRCSAPFRWKPNPQAPARGSGRLSFRNRRVGPIPVDRRSGFPPSEHGHGNPGTRDPRARRACDRRTRRFTRLHADPAAQPRPDARDQAQRRPGGGRRQQDRARGNPQRRRPARRRPAARRPEDHRRPLRRRHHAGAGPALDPHRRRAHRGGARVRPARRAPARRLHRQGGQRAGDPELLAVDRARRRAGHTERSAARFRGRQRAQVERCDRPAGHPPLRILRPAHGVRPLPAAPSAAAAGARDAAALLHAHRLRAGRQRGRYVSDQRNAGTLSAAVVARIHRQLAHPVQRRHLPRAAQLVLPARLAARYAGVDLRQVRRRGQAQQVRRRHRPGLLAGALARLADQGHQRPLQRPAAVAEDAGCVGRRGQPGRQAQGRGLRVSGIVARRHRGFPGAARQHRRRRAARAQPQHRQLDSGRVHAPRRGRPRVVAVRSQSGAAAGRLLGRTVRAGLRGGRGRRPGGEDGEGARAVRAHDAHAGADRQRLDDLQGPLQRHQQPDRRPGQRDPPVQPVHRNPGSELGQRDGGMQSRLDQPGPARA